MEVKLSNNLLNKHGHTFVCRLAGVSDTGMNLTKLLMNLMLLYCGFLAFKHFQNPESASSNHDQQNFSSNQAPQVQRQKFSCDGRQHCSQMTSREEAEYFVKYCPNTKMDGNRDGISCERDTRW